MILAKKIFDTLKKNKVSFFIGVPDSVLKNLSNYFGKLKKNKHIIAANEGSAISIGIGYYLSTKRIACVYLQNSGLGNAINPLTAVAHSKVYSIPMLLLIGWRGSPNVKDEPQHKVKGEITRELLKLMGIKYCLLRNKNDLKKLNKIIKISKRNKKPVACLIEKNTLLNQQTIKRKKTDGRKRIQSEDHLYQVIRLARIFFVMQ